MATENSNGKPILALPKSESELRAIRKKLSSMNEFEIKKLTRLCFRAYSGVDTDKLNTKFMDACLDECHRRGIDPPSTYHSNGSNP